MAGFFDPASLYREIAPAGSSPSSPASPYLVGHPIELRRFLVDLRRASRFDYLADGCSETACELITVAVQPRLRRQGYGTALIQRWWKQRRAAERLNCESISVPVTLVWQPSTAILDLSRFALLPCSVASRWTKTCWRLQKNRKPR